MKLKIKYYLSSPYIYVVATIFLITVPYLYPQHFFIYKKAFTINEHLIFSFMFIILILAGFCISSLPKLKLKKIYIEHRKDFCFNKNILTISLLMVILSLLVNLLIVINGFTYLNNGNVLTAKNSLDDFGGVNILSQFYMFFLPILQYWSLSKKKYYVNVLLIFLGIILFIRSALLAERLAFIEYIIPIIVIYSYHYKMKLGIIKVIKYFLYFLLFFIALELTRQFYVQFFLESDKDVDFLFAITWALERFFAYYADTQNKLYFVIENQFSFSTYHFLYPVERVLMRVFSINMISPQFDYNEFNWKDFTNPGGISMLYTDFGYFFILCIIIIFSLFFILWKKINSGSIIALAIYPHFVVGILEIPRFIYFYLTRFAYPFVFFISIYFALVYFQYKLQKLKN